MQWIHFDLSAYQLINTNKNLDFLSLNVLAMLFNCFLSVDQYVINITFNLSHRQLPSR